jgi:hypothetical protein
LRRVGARDYLAYAITNLAQALLMLGDWDAADAELTQAADFDALADYEFLACYRGWLAALHGDAATVQAVLAGLGNLRDITATRELLTLLDSRQPGHLAPMLRAERDLARARLAAGDGDPAEAAAFAGAISSLRELSTPYHLAHGLLDYAQHLMHTGDVEGGTAAVQEARDIAGRLRCQPLLDRAAILAPAASAVPADRA